MEFLKVAIPIVLYLLTINLVAGLLIRYFSNRKKPFEVIYGSTFVAALCISSPLIIYHDSIPGILSMALAGGTIGLAGTLFHSWLLFLRIINRRALYDKVVGWLDS